MNSRTTSPPKNYNGQSVKEKEFLLKLKDDVSIRATEKLRLAGVSGTAGSAGVNTFSGILPPHQGPGIFFDMQKGEQFQKLEQSKKNLAFRSTSQCQFNGTRGSGMNFQEPGEKMGMTDKMRGSMGSLSSPISQSNSVLAPLPQSGSKLYSPYEYLQYATKVSESRDNYLTGLQQLGYQNVDELNAHSYNDIVTRTENIIQRSYCLKYLGVIDGNMGVLSKRVKIKNQLSEQQQKQQFLAKINSQRRYETDLRQRRKNGLPVKPPTENVSNISIVPSNYRPDLYNSYLITQYSLPKYLKPIVKERDPLILDDKLRLALWHAEQLKKDSNLLSQEDITSDKQPINANPFQQQSNQFSINNTSSLNQTQSLTQNFSQLKGGMKKSTKFKFGMPNNSETPKSIQTACNSPTRQIFSEDLIPLDQSSQQEVPSSNQSLAPSYSRLLTKIQLDKIEKNKINNYERYETNPKNGFYSERSANKPEYSKAKKQQQGNIMLETQLKFTQNKQMQERFDHIEKFLIQKKMEKEQASQQVLNESETVFE